MSTTPSKAAAEIAANEYAFNMASEPEPTRTHFLNGFNQGVAWRPEVSEGYIKQAADYALSKFDPIGETEQLIAAESAYLAASADAAKRIAELEEACAAKDKAIAEALIIIDERESEAGEMKRLLTAMADEAHGNGSSSERMVTVKQMSAPFRKETGR